MKRATSSLVRGATLKCWLRSTPPSSTMNRAVITLNVLSFAIAQASFGPWLRSATTTTASRATAGMKLLLQK